MTKVMLVEDDNNLREIYEARLAAEGFDIVAAPDGESALALAAKEHPDLVISDVMMPKISGFEMLDIMRNTESLRNVKVIMLTALGQAEDSARAGALGADRYLVKSQVTLEDIVKAVHDVLAGDSAVAPSPTTPAPAAAEPAAVSSQPVSAAPTAVAAEPAAVAVETAPEPDFNVAAMPVAAAPTDTADAAAASTAESDNDLNEQINNFLSQADSQLPPAGQSSSDNSTSSSAPLGDSAQQAPVNDPNLAQAVAPSTDSAAPAPVVDSPSVQPGLEPDLSQPENLPTDPAASTAPAVAPTSDPIQPVTTPAAADSTQASGVTADQPQVMEVVEPPVEAPEEPAADSTVESNSASAGAPLETVAPVAAATPAEFHLPNLAAEQVTDAQSATNGSSQSDSPTEPTTTAPTENTEAPVEADTAKPTTDSVPSFQPQPVDETSDQTPDATAVSGVLPTSAKKVITPLQSESKPDIHQLLAVEEAKAAAQQVGNVLQPTAQPEPTDFSQPDLNLSSPTETPAAPAVEAAPAAPAEVSPAAPAPQGTPAAAAPQAPVDQPVAPTAQPTQPASEGQTSAVPAPAQAQPTTAAQASPAQPAPGTAFQPSVNLQGVDPAAVAL